MPSHSSLVARLAATLSSLLVLGIKDGAIHSRILRDALAHHEHIFGLWTWWEGGILEDNGEGKPQAVRLSWHRSRAGGFKSAPVKTSSGSDFHGLPACNTVVKTQRFHLAGPYVGVLEKRDRLLSTIAMPIIVGQKLSGVVGLDFALDSLAEKVSKGCDETMMEVMDVITAELNAGLIFLDANQHVIAWSSSAPVILGEFIKTPLQWGRRLPSELCAASEQGPPGGQNAQCISGRGLVLKVARSKAKAHQPVVMMLAKEEADLQMSRLSDRENEVMRWLAEGKSNEEIGIILSISPHTVKNHLDRIYRKIGVDNRHAAMLAWTRASALAGALPTP